MSQDAASPESGPDAYRRYRTTGLPKADGGIPAVPAAPVRDLIALLESAALPPEAAAKVREIRALLPAG